jgi:uncharacterized protein YecT (DUF1311 family)
MTSYLKSFLIAGVLISYIRFSLTDTHSASICKSSEKETTIYPIDKKQEDCIRKDPSTINVINCTAKAYESWGNELEKNYLELMQELSPAGKELLKASQLEWIKYRDKELKLLNHMSGNFSGSLYRVECAQDRVNLVKDRALELKEYLALNYEND